MVMPAEEAAVLDTSHAITRTHDNALQRTPLWTLKALQLFGTAAWACLGKFIVVFYADIGLSRSQIGVLLFIGPTTSFFGQFFWAGVIDRVGDYKWPLVSTTVVGSLITFCQLLPFVQQHFFALLVVQVGSSLLLCTGGPIVDAMCLTVLDEQDESEGYGDQRLWCAVGWGGMSLIAGQMVDMFGIDVIFVGYAIFQCINMAICVIWLPGKTRAPKESDSAGRTHISQLFSFDVIWFFLNIFQYGLAMCLVENFLLVFLVQDFDNTPRLLVGLSVAVMCAFEVPVFKYADRLWKRYDFGLTYVIFCCQLVLVLRCWLYMLLPPQCPWLVLFIEPLHGFTFAGMWVATVEYGKRLAPPQFTARMQTLVNGIFYQLALGLGSVLWGMLVEPPPHGLGFKRCFLADSAVLLGWCAAWLLGLMIRGRQRDARTLRNSSACLGQSMQPS